MKSRMNLIQTLTEQLYPIYGSHAVAEHNAWWLIETLYNKDRTQLLTHSFTLNQQQENQLKEWIRQITVEHVPIQYIIGNVPFLNLTIMIQPPVIIPRPETEYWTHLLIKQLEPHISSSSTILDLCTGSGCISLALAQAFPDASIYAVDIAEYALALARQNSTLNNLANITWLQGDLYSALPPGLTFDLIVSNPPYIDPNDWQSLDKEVTKWEDPRGLIAPNRGYAIIETIIDHAPLFLKPISPPFPQLWIEIGAEQGQESITLLKKRGFTQTMLLKDLSGHDRVIIGTR